MEKNGSAYHALDAVVHQKIGLLNVGERGRIESPVRSPFLSIFPSPFCSPLPSPIHRPISPLCDESVQGYTTDSKPLHNGAKAIVAVIHTIEKSGTPCAVVGEPALIYYGTKRLMVDWIICVPTEQQNHVVKIFKNHPDKYELFRPNALQAPNSLKSRFPRFKLVGQAVFFLIMSSQACHLCITPENIEYDRWIRIPYPTLSAYAQSLLDTWSLTDLEDLVDGMNLSAEWGEKNLDLEGVIDQDWACWRETYLAEREITVEELPRWSKPKRAIWNKVSSDEAKKKRQGLKSRPEQLTRFWISGQQDPRMKFKDYS